MKYVTRIEYRRKRNQGRWLRTGGFFWRVTSPNQAIRRIRNVMQQMRQYRRYQFRIITDLV